MNKYDTGLKEVDEIFENFVGKQLFEDIIKDIKPIKGDCTTQHRIITGCRGSGKTHLIKALYAQINKDKTLKKHYIPVRMPEELYMVDSLYRFLQESCIRLVEEVSGIKKYQKLKKEWEELLSKIKAQGSDKKKRGQAEVEMMDYLNHFHESSKKKIVLFCENMQDLLGDVLSDDEQKRLRAFLNESLHTMLIIGTSVSVFTKVKDHGKPFYHFFQFREIPELDKEESYQFLAKYARYHNDIQVGKRLKKNKHKIYAYQTLTGGNPRMLLVLYDYLKDASEFETGKLLEKLITELTPYYKHETDKLSPQKRIILTGVLMGPPAKTPSEISLEVQEPLRTVVTQLNRLKKDNWIRSYPMKPGKGVKKSEEFYIVREYFYRIWYQLRTCSNCKDSIRWMAELASLLFSEDELKEKLKLSKGAEIQTKSIYEEALSLLKDEKWIDSLKRIYEYSKSIQGDDIDKLISKIEMAMKSLTEEVKNDKLKSKTFDTLIETSAKLLSFQNIINLPGAQESLGRVISFAKLAKGDHVGAYEHMSKIKGQTGLDNFIWRKIASAYTEQEEYDRAIQCAQKAIDIDPDDYMALVNLSFAHSKLGDHKKAVKWGGEAARIKPDDFNVWINLGTIYIDVNEYKKIIECSKKAIDLNPKCSIAWYQRGYAYGGIDQDKEAIECYKKTVELDASFPQAWYSLGASYSNIGEYTLALEALLRFAETTPQFGHSSIDAFDVVKSSYSKKEKHSGYLQIVLNKEISFAERASALLILILMGKVDIIQESIDSMLQQDFSTEDAALKHLLFFANFGLIDALKDQENVKAIESLSKFYCSLLNVMQVEKANQKILQFLVCSVKILEKESIQNIKKVFQDWKEAGLDIPDVVSPIIDAAMNPDSREARKWEADPMFREITEMLKD